MRPVAAVILEVMPRGHQGGIKVNQVFLASTGFHELTLSIRLVILKDRFGAKLQSC